MKAIPNTIDYGVYIDHRQSFIIKLYTAHGSSPVIEYITEVTDEDSSQLNYYHFQHKGKEYIHKLCRAIINRLDHAQRMLIFGPAEAKYELRRELQATGTVMVEEREHLVTTDAMSEAEALRFSTRHLKSNSTVKPN